MSSNSTNANRFGKNPATLHFVMFVGTYPCIDHRDVSRTPIGYDVLLGRRHHDLSNGSGRAFDTPLSDMAAPVGEPNSAQSPLREPTLRRKPKKFGQ